VTPSEALACVIFNNVFDFLKYPLMYCGCLLCNKYSAKCYAL
jgi:hypothetical protein